MAAMRWQGTQEEDIFEDALKRFLQDLTDRFGDLRAERSIGHGGQQQPGPLVSVEDAGDCYRIFAELPGVVAADLRVSAGEKSLVVEGSWKKMREEPNFGWHLKETRQGRFRRIVELPGPVCGETARAVLENGMLEVQLQKAQKSLQGHFDIDLD